MTTPDLAHLRELIVQVAREEALAGFTGIAHKIKRDGSVVTEIDHRMQARIRAQLARHWPEYGFLGEEMGEIQQRAALAAPGAGLWCLDPLDGTTNFAAGLPFFSVSLGLVVAGRAELGLVYDPVRDECFTAQRGRGAWLNGEALARPTEMELRRCIACVDFKRLPAHLAGRLAQAFPYTSQRSIGSSALDWCWLATGRFQVYLHGGQKLWDFVAGELILREAGGHSTTLDGEPVYANDLGPRSVVAAITPKLFDEWKAWIDANKLKIRVARDKNRYE